MRFFAEWSKRLQEKRAARERREELQQALGIAVMDAALRKVTPTHNFPGRDDIGRLKRIMTDFPMGGPQAVSYYFANPSRPRMSFIFYLAHVIDECVNWLSLSHRELEKLAIGQQSKFTREEIASALDMALATTLNCVHIILSDYKSGVAERFLIPALKKIPCDACGQSARVWLETIENDRKIKPKLARYD